MISLCRRKLLGFGCIEILISLGVISVGILGITAMQSVIITQSHNNKSASEALSIAQSRIEELRNVASRASSTSEFETFYADTSGFKNTTPISGLSAVFTRTESFSTARRVKSVAVNVAWNDSDGIMQSVLLSATLSFISPRSLGVAARAPSRSVVKPPI